MKPTGLTLMRTAKEGYFPGSLIPFGYKWISEKINYSNLKRKKLAAHPEESKVVIKIFELASLSTPLNKNTALKISKHLNEQNVSCREKPWTPYKIISLLHNTIYTGEYLIDNRRLKVGKNEAPIKICVAPIITKGLFAQVNKK